MPDTVYLVDAEKLLRERFELQRRAFAAEPYPSLQVRLDRLRRLEQMVVRNEQAINEAIHTDFSCRSAHETQLSELFVLYQGLRHARANLGKWMRLRRMPTEIYFRPGYSRLQPQPLGVVGIISPWNFPLQLSLGPALAALAAGNRVLIKPSEHTPAFSGLLTEMVAATFSPEEMDVVTGDEEVGKVFAGLPFDHLFFTGSTAVGRKVAQEAAANLTSVTLELGGKCPAILDASCDLEAAISKIAFAKFLNAGQTCIAPDYLLVPAGKASQVADRLVAAVAKFYPSLQHNPDYTAIINTAHRQRLTELVREAREAGARVIEVNPAQERFDEESRKFPPTLVLDAPAQVRLMREEIFGPVLPIVEYEGVDAAIAHVERGERPLALYWFGQDKTVRERMLKETISGGVTVNDCFWHFAQESLPFGGVGASGMGAYHGAWGFRTFSKEKAVFYQSRLNGVSLFYPPFGKRFEWLMRFFKRIL